MQWKKSRVRREICAGEETEKLRKGENLSIFETELFKSIKTARVRHD